MINRNIPTRMARTSAISVMVISMSCINICFLPYCVLRRRAFDRSIISSMLGFSASDARRSCRPDLLAFREIINGIQTSQASFSRGIDRYHPRSAPSCQVDYLPRPLFSIRVLTRCRCPVCKYGDNDAERMELVDALRQALLHFLHDPLEVLLTFDVRSSSAWSPGSRC